MTTRINRRQFEALLGWSGAAIALSELGLAWPVRAEEGFTVASTGASWGEGLRTAFIDGPKFEQAHKVKVTQEFGIDSVIRDSEFEPPSLHQSTARYECFFTKC